MHAAGRHQAQQMRRAGAGLQAGNEGLERRQAGNRAAGDGIVDARQALLHDTPGTQRHVTDFGISHLTGGQTDIALRRFQPAMRAGRHQAVPDRGVGQGNGVVVARLALAPTVEDAQDNGVRRIQLNPREVSGPEIRAMIVEIRYR